LNVTLHKGRGSGKGTGTNIQKRKGEQGDKSPTIGQKKRVEEGGEKDKKSIIKELGKGK